MLDLCLSCSALLTGGRVECGPDLGSDHIPIVCTFGLEVCKTGAPSAQRWLHKRANWTGWSHELECSSLPTALPASVDELDDTLCKHVIDTSKQFIPQSSGKPSCRRSTPWWDSECARFVALRRKARNKLARCPSLPNLIAYKRSCAIAKFHILQKKRKSWESFVHSLTPDINLQTFWRGGQSGELMVTLAHIALLVWEVLMLP